MKGAVMNMRAMRRWTLPVLVVAACGSCGVSGGEGDTTATDRVDEAWRRYRLGQYESAASLFLELTLEDVELAESSGGLGWSRLRMLNPSGARQAFQSSLVADVDWMDSRAGEVFALRDGGSSADALLNRARDVLRADADWRFVHEPSVDWRDLRMTAAQVYYYTQRFDSCLAYCRAVDSSLGLERSDSLSWQGAASFEAALLREVERLTAEVTQ
jgi:hypothetical protein